MPGSPSHLNRLRSRRELLVAESEVNRAQLSAEWRATTDGVRGLHRQLSTWGSWASSAVLLVLGARALRRSPAPAGSTRMPWWRRLLGAAGLAANAWAALRPRDTPRSRT